jgi:predicted small lipoprotein YifL
VKKIEGLSVLVAWRVPNLIAAIFLPMVLTSCGKKGPDGEKKTAQKARMIF